MKSDGAIVGQGQVERQYVDVRVTEQRSLGIRGYEATNALNGQPAQVSRMLAGLRAALERLAAHAKPKP